MLQPDSFAGKLVLAARRRRPVVRVTVSPWWVRILVAAGAQRAPEPSPELPTAANTRKQLAQVIIDTRGCLRHLQLAVGNRRYRDTPSVIQIPQLRKSVDAASRCFVASNRLVHERLAQLAGDANIGDVAEVAYLGKLESATTEAFEILKVIDFLSAELARGAGQSYSWRQWGEEISALVHLDLPLNVSGIDLSDAIFEIVDLHGAIWSDTTRWPGNRIAKQVAGMSDEVAPGTYQVRSGTDRAGGLLLPV